MTFSGQDLPVTAEFSFDRQRGGVYRGVVFGSASAGQLWFALETCNGVASHSQSLFRLQRWHAARFKALNGVGTLKQLPTTETNQNPRVAGVCPRGVDHVHPRDRLRAPGNHGVKMGSMSTLHEGR